MAVIFPPWTNKIPYALAAVVPTLCAATAGAAWYWLSPAHTDVGYQPVQPVEFSHARHVAELSVDCRYCHTTVELAAHAAVPPTESCMNCHRIVLAKDARMELTLSTYAEGTPIPWVRVHLLPDHAFFDHSAHLAVGVGCVTCHGRVDEMAVVRQVQPLSMSWCLDCHRNPTPELRPIPRITSMTYSPAEAGYDPGADPERPPRSLSPPEHCSGCHR